MMDIPVNSRRAVSCRHCFMQTAEDSARCESCGREVESAAPKTFLGKIKQALGIDPASDIIAINLEDNGYFFSPREIDYLLSLEHLTVLGLEDVPDYETMFYKSKRIQKPFRRNRE